MEYAKIRNIIRLIRSESKTPKMSVANYDHFSVMSIDDKKEAIIVDAYTAESLCGRKWCLDSDGYPVISYMGNVIRLHDCVMAMIHEHKPDGCYVDHINLDKLDNRIQNLRFVTPLESPVNMPLKADNTSGYTGVSKTKYGTFRAYITVNKKRIDLGQYKRIEDAVAARRKAEDLLGFDTRPGTVKEAIYDRITQKHTD